jgi:hypothetical protein
LCSLAIQCEAVEGENPFGGLFGDPDDLQRRLSEFAEQMQGAQRVAWADNAIKLAVDMTVAGLQRINLQGNADQQAQDLLQAMRLIFPEAVILVREAREGFGTT